MSEESSHKDPTFCLLIMHPREIPKVVISLKKINLPKVWFRGYDLKGVTSAMHDYIKANNFDYYIIVSDDVIVTQEAVDIVVENLPKYKVFTGYCNLYQGSTDVNLCKEPLTLQNGKFPIIEDYLWMSQQEVNEYNDVFKTHLIAMSLTGMSRDMWLKYPPGCYVNDGPRGRSYCSSDHNLSYRLGSDSVEMWTHPKCFVEHLKKSQRKTMIDGWLVGNVIPGIIEELDPHTLWIPNQHVKIYKENPNTTLIRSNQSKSTPGVFKLFYAIPKHNYEIIVDGYNNTYNNSTLFVGLLKKDSKLPKLSRVVLNEKLESGKQSQNFTVSFMPGSKVNQQQMAVGILFSNPNKLSQFEVADIRIEQKKNAH